MQVFPNLFKSFLYEIDFFKAPFFFNIYNNRNKLSTHLGSIFSLIILIFLLFVFSSSEMMQKTNPAVISQSISVEKRPKFSFKPSDFQISFQIFDKELKGYAIDPSIFSLNVFQLSNTFDSLNEQKNHYLVKNYSQCNFTTSTIISYCMEDDFELEGYPYQRYNTSFLVFDLFLCQNSSVKTCKSEEEISNFFVNKGIFFTYTDHNFQYNDYLNPIQTSKSSDYIWLDSKMTKSLNIFIKKNEFFDDSNPIFNDPKVIETFSRDYSVWDLTQGVSINRTNSPIAEIIFWSSSNIQQYKRTYQKIDQVLGSLAGIFNILFLISFFLVGIQNYLKINRFMVENLYCFENENKNQVNKYLNTMKIQEFNIKTQKEIKKAPDLIKKQEVQIELISKPRDENMRSKLREKIHKDSLVLEKNSLEMNDEESDQEKNQIEKNENIKENSKETNKFKKFIIKINLIQYGWIKLKSFFKMKQTNCEKIFLKAESECLMLINLKSVFKGLQEIEKLKAVIFSKEQLNLFNLLSQPVLKLNENIDSSNKYDMFQIISNSGVRNSNNCDKREKLNQAMNYYQKIQKSQTFSEVDQRLCNFFCHQN